jgi:hypothetical protein
MLAENPMCAPFVEIRKRNPLPTVDDAFVAPMHRAKNIKIALSLVAGMAMFSKAMPARAESPSGPSAEEISQIAARLIADAIPRQYERSDDWGRTKSITTGLRSSGNFFKFDIHRRKSEVKHGVWKKYRVVLIEPEKNLVVRIDNLREIGPGRTALTLSVAAKLHGWARAKV